MDLKKHIKLTQNNGNEYPSKSKRSKLSSSKSLNLIKKDEDKNILEEMGIGILETDESSTASSIIESSSINVTTEDILLPKLICHNGDSNDENLNCTNINLLSPDNLTDENESYPQQQQQQLQKEQQQNNQQLSEYFKQLREKYRKNSTTDNNISSNNNSSIVNMSTTNSFSQICSTDYLNNATNNSLCEKKNKESSVLLPPPPLAAASVTAAMSSVTPIINNTNNNYKSSNTSIEIYVDNCGKITDRILKKFDNNTINSSSSNNTTNSKFCRSPLSIVSYNNNNLSNTHYQNTSLTQIQTTKDISKKNQYYHHNHQQQQYRIPSNETFFLYRNQLQTKNSFNKLSDEMILQIFKWLPKKTLIRCGMVCRRFNQVSQDESLWTRLDLSGRILKSGTLGHVLPRGVVILRLAHTELRHPVFETNHLENLIDYETKLQYLDLSMAVITKPSLKMLLSKCRKLKKLSLEHIKLNDEICMEISKNCNLEALNLTMCDGIESWSIKNMMIELKQLQSLNVSWTSLNVESVKALVDCITTNLLRLNISGCRKTMFDSHLATLSKRCPKLLELDLSDCTALTSAAVDLICNFKQLEYLSLSRCYGISASSYMKLKCLSSLSYLDVFGLLSETALTVLQNAFPAVGINKFIYSSVARPTVGTRRTSIWGLRTRD